MIPNLNLKHLAKHSLLFIVIILSSCASRQDLVYFQDEPLPSAVFENPNFEIHYKTDDLITIDISALDPEAAKPFNLPVVTYSDNIMLAQGNLKMQTYLINANGEIEFPVLGTIKLGGLTRSQATAYLKERLTEYIKDPIVNIRLVNFTISVLGEVNRPGTYNVQDERISVLEAIGLAGDLSIYGVRNNVLLIREVDGQKRFAKLDLTSINMVNSPTYYLEQNDIIYVEPNKAKVRSSTFNPNTGVVISAVGTLATIVAILIR